MVRTKAVASTMLFYVGIAGQRTHTVVDAHKEAKTNMRYRFYIIFTRTAHNISPLGLDQRQNSPYSSSGLSIVPACTSR